MEALELFIILLILALLVCPLILSIIALVKLSSLKQDLESLNRRFQSHLAKPQNIPLEVKKEPVQQAPEPKVVPTPISVPKAGKSPSQPEQSIPAKKPYTPVHSDYSLVHSKPNLGIEFLMGGRGAAFAGIAVLVIGIALLVGYAIQHSWIGPGTRTILGLLSGGVLVAVGHLFERKDKKFCLLARTLTGGGGSLFYFCVFAAYGFYHLIGPWEAGAGLIVSALAIFGLAMVYNSQTVAILAVIGAFITPSLLGRNFGEVDFSLIYIALLNVPVILLGVRRKWQWLYNLAFGFTVFYYGIWWDNLKTPQTQTGLLYAGIYFAECAILGLLKLKGEQQTTGRSIDIFRLILSSLLLLLVTRSFLRAGSLEQWVGSAFILLALVHILLAYFAFRVLNQYKQEILSFLAGGLIFAILALPAQLDGIWVSIGWAIEGVILAWFALQVRSQLLQLCAFVLGVIGIGKTLVWDASFYHATPALFLNGRFIVGILSAALLGLQGHLASRFSPDEEPKPWSETMWWFAVIAFVIVMITDIFWTIESRYQSSWVISSLAIALIGMILLLFIPKKSTLSILGGFLLICLPVKIFLLDGLIGCEHTVSRHLAFQNPFFWSELVILLSILFLLPRIQSRDTQLMPSGRRFNTLANTLSLASAIGIASLEILRIKNSWGDSFLTLFWAISALTLILFGMKLRTAAHRYFGLFLFGFTILKVLLIDSSGLNELQRIAAFIGTGLLLLVLAFVYQKASAYFKKSEQDS